MKVVLAQLNFVIGDFEGNAQKIIKHITKAKNEGADMVVFSELSVTGYYPYDLLGKKEFIRKAEETVVKIAKHCNGIAAITGAPSFNERGNQLFNSAFFLNNGKIECTYNKTLLSSCDNFCECRYFEPGRNFSIIEYKGEKIAVTIGGDLDSAQNKLNQASPVNEFIKYNPDFVVNISALPFSHNEDGQRKNELVSRAKEHGIPIVYVNQAGAYTELIFDGGSVFINERGEITKELNYFKEDYTLVDTKKSSEINLQNNTCYIEKIHDALVLGIGDYFAKTGFRSALIGLSGGIDSAVTTALAVRALGSENVRVLLMPSKYSSAHSLSDAIKLAENLNIRYDIIPVQRAVDTFENELAPLFAGLPPNVTEENIQARTRGVYAMALSNKFGNILLNTTNKSEYAVGYGTLYGDMNGGLAVLGDVYKTDVYKLSRFINRCVEIIPENSILKPPSAELKPDQKDTDSLPEYEYLDRILFSIIEMNKSPEEIIDSGFDANTVKRVVNMINMSEYKRFQAAPILKVSSKALGAGTKIPLVARY
ncbi:MAG: NAD+ synthase [Bacteroidales bacterium]|jgi:NAD+ synthase (glutamine-hydrolysing)|nr:NAD+ synthase [Bacteroidales bacterium]